MGNCCAHDAKPLIAADYVVEQDPAVNAIGAANQQAMDNAVAAAEAVENLAEAVAVAAGFVMDDAGVVQGQAAQAADVTETTKEQARDSGAAVDGAVESVAEVIAEAAGLVKDGAGVVQGTAIQVADAGKLVAETVVETIDATMDAAVAAVTGVVVVDFGGEKGPEQQVAFSTCTLGLELGLSKGGCCAPKSQARVVVKRVVKGGQAEALGVKHGSTMKSVNGVEVTGLEQAKKLLAECATKLPVA